MRFSGLGEVRARARAKTHQRGAVGVFDGMLRIGHIMTEKPRFRLRDLTDREHRRYDGRGYVKFEKYPARYVDKDGVAGKFWTQEELDRDRSEKQRPRPQGHLPPACD